MAGTASHLSYREKTNLGSFYTPRKIVLLAYEMLRRSGIAACDVVLDSSCGNGAFFSVPFPLGGSRFVGGDVDKIALAEAARSFPHVRLFCKNALSEISRERYGILPNESLIIVGNPPYNDVTSRVKNSVKSADSLLNVDAEIRTRDLGISFFLSFAKLDPEAVLVLHPLSYLIKEGNFKLLAPFMRNYALRDVLVFSSCEFAETSRLGGFPVVVALYERSLFGTTYAEIVRRRFRTLEGAEFALSDFDFIGRHIPKYPQRCRRNSCGKYKFFTMRDINALKRSRTFITDDSANTIYVPDSKLAHYCYVDIFKDFASRLPYFFGNLDVFIDERRFEPLREDFLLLSAQKHPTIFGKDFGNVSDACVPAARSRVNNYFNELFSAYVHS